jgi:3-oxoacyl-(acyl-carrier-protein) synthase
MIYPVSVTECVIGFPGEDNPFHLKHLESVWYGETKIKKWENSDFVRIQKIIGSESVPCIGSKLEPIDLIRDYQVPSNIVDKMDLSVQYAVAAGLELFKKKGISLYDGKGRLKGLPNDLQEQVGVISVGVFPSHITLLQDNLSPDYIYKIVVKANAHLAQLIQAKGPNIYIDTACSSTVSALSLAQDWIRLGRCTKVVIIGAECSSQSDLLPYLAYGFHSIKVLTTDGMNSIDPFGTNRSGMILGSGAFAMLLEKEESIHLCPRLVYSDISNSCHHIVSLDVDFITERLQSLVNKILSFYNITLERFSKEVCYFSHETSSPSCALVEIESLRQVFGLFFSDVMICNTKGITGHCLGVSLEDPIAVESLKTSILPFTICNKVDPRLGELQLSKGEVHNRRFIIRFSAGFGSYVGMLVYDKKVVNESTDDLDRSK